MHTVIPLVSYLLLLGGGSALPHQGLLSLPTTPGPLTIRDTTTFATSQPASQSRVHLHSRISAIAPNAVSLLQQIAPNSSSCTSTGADAPPFPSECATANAAAPHLIAAFQKYDVTSAWEISCVLALIAFESGEFQYDINHYPAPGRPGQGTRNMQMPDFNIAYARSVPELADKVTQITGSASTTAEGLTPDQLNAVRALVLDDEYSWASGAWFLKTKCDAATRATIQAGGTTTAWAAYLACVGVRVSDDRTVYFTRATAAFGLS